MRGEMVRLDGIEPTTSVWKTEVLPLNYRREGRRSIGVPGDPSSLPSS